MCTALVVREEYWDRQIKVCAELSGYRLSNLQLTVVKKFVEDCWEKVIECINYLANVIVEVFNVFKDTLVDTIQALHKLFKESEITPNDDFDTVCDKLENRMLYLNRKEYIRQEQYYKAQFKLAKISYNVMNHDRRC